VTGRTAAYSLSFGELSMFNDFWYLYILAPRMKSQL
jgi:hypothetical protein